MQIKFIPRFKNSVFLFLAAYPSPGFSSDKKKLCCTFQTVSFAIRLTRHHDAFFSSEAITLRSGREIMVFGETILKINTV